MPHLIPALAVSVFPALVIAAALKDAVSYTIPNWLSLALLAAFAVAAPVCGLPMAAIGLHAGVGAVGLAAGMAMFALGWIGGGDAKVFAAAALWLGWPAVLPYAAATGLAGGALAVSLLGLRSSLMRPYVARAPAWFSRLAEPGENVPYGLAIAAGALIAFPGSDLARPLFGL